MAEKDFEQKVLQLLGDMNQRFDAMDRRFDGMDQRFDAIDRRFDGMDQRIEDMDRRMAEGFEEARQERAGLSQKLDVLQDQVVSNSERFTEVEGIKKEQRYQKYKIMEHDRQIFSIREKLDNNL